MSGRFENFLLAGLVAITIAVCVALAYHLSDHEERFYAGRVRADQELTEKRDGNRRPAIDRSICREAKTEKEYELCQAWRNADAARDAADIDWQ